MNHKSKKLTFAGQLLDLLADGRLRSKTEIKRALGLDPRALCSRLDNELQVQQRAGRLVCVGKRWSAASKDAIAPFSFERLTAGLEALDRLIADMESAVESCRALQRASLTPSTTQALEREAAQLEAFLARLRRICARLRRPGGG